MPITNRTLEPGTVLIATYKKVLHRCEVVASDAGPRYRLDGVDHKSPSTAASAVVGGNRNGWTFWSVGGPRPRSRWPSRRWRRPSARRPTRRA